MSFKHGYKSERATLRDEDHLLENLIGPEMSLLLETERNIENEYK